MWNKICKLEALSPCSGVGAVVGEHQVALFFLPDTRQQVFALDNWDPLGRAFVISRGIVGDIDGEPVVASPLYKQHYRLSSGECVERADVELKTWPVKIEDNHVWIRC